MEARGGRNLLFTVCIIGCLARYHQVIVHTAGLPEFHSTPGVGFFYILGTGRRPELSRSAVSFPLLLGWVQAAVFSGTGE